MPSPENKVVLVTGASSGIGERTARVLAEHGASVVLGARRTDKLMSIASEIVGRGGSVRFRSLDVANLDDVKAFADFAEAEFGRIDVIVNNAGVMPLSPLSALKIDEWNWMNRCQHPWRPARDRRGAAEDGSARARPYHQRFLSRRVRRSADRRRLRGHQVRGASDL
jgi:NAD(P)-dependent dehydrogenase (short-subunit alcohol dehydrogenase family)